MSLSLHVALATVLVACNGGNASPPEPFTGRLTIEMLLAQERKIPLCVDPFDLALAKLANRIGPPTKIDGDKFIWAVADGDRCAIMQVDRGTCPASWKKDGLRFASTTEPMVTTPASTIGNHAECLKQATVPPAP